jgi:formylglycine-generating enzyme required for sulfatase activity
LSEAEWEYVARAGTKAAFSTGDRITTDQANFNGDYTFNGSAKGTYRGWTVPVGSFRPNAFGLYDMHGNVFEWVSDCWHDSYQDAPANGSAWTSNGNCSIRVVRGGSWYSKPGSLRAAFRLKYDIGFRDIVFGFRVARTLSR